MFTHKLTNVYQKNIHIFTFILNMFTCIYIHLNIHIYNFTQMTTPIFTQEKVNVLRHPPSQPFAHICAWFFLLQMMNIFCPRKLCWAPAYFVTNYFYKSFFDNSFLCSKVIIFLYSQSIKNYIWHDGALQSTL